MSLRIRPSISGLPTSATLMANQTAVQRRNEGHEILHMGFGQSPFPVHQRLSAALGDNAGANAYEHVAGLPALRDAARSYFANALGVDAEDYDVIVAPGSKLILYALQMAIEGDLLHPVPSWVSYAPQAAMLGDRVIPVTTNLSDAGYLIDPGHLAETIRQTRADGANPTKLILNSPNNPTGLSISPDQHAAIVDVCAREGIFVISDEIYSLVAFDRPHLSIASAYPEATAITTGLSKHLSLGGWRVGFGLIPRRTDRLFGALCAVASETWSSVAAPVQRAVIPAVSGDPEIEDYIRTCTRIHAAVTRFAANRIAGPAVLCPLPSGAFYMWPDFAPIAALLARAGIRTSQHLADRLLERHDVLTLPGSGFGAPPERLCLRLSACDYDGAQAIETCTGLRDPAEAIDSFAPRVVAATEAIQQFIAEFVDS